LPPVDRLRLGAVTALLKAMPTAEPLEGVTAASWLRRWMGQRTYDAVWEPLLRGKFGDQAEEIAMPWFWARVHCRSQDLGYLRGGFQLLYDRLAERIRELGGSLALGCTVTGIESLASGMVRVETTLGARDYDRVIVTLPTRLFLRLAQGLPSDYRERYEHGSDHLSAHCLILGLDRPLSDIYWLSIADAAFPFLSLVEHTNFMPPEDYGGRHLVYLGDYLPPDHSRFAMQPEEIRDLYLPHLRKVNPSFDPTWVKELWSFSGPFAQPIVRLGYRKKLPPHGTPLRGVYLANMGHVYPQDRGQNYSLLLGEKIARIAGEERDDA
jgi:protoporphyrinogen oxidase